MNYIMLVNQIIFKPAIVRNMGERFTTCVCQYFKYIDEYDKEIFKRHVVNM